MKPIKPIIFSDLDGSLLDHHTYSHAFADFLLGSLEEKAIPVVLNTSKTKAELCKLRVSLNNKHPFIIENGAAIYVPEDYFSNVEADFEKRDGFWVKSFCQPRSHWLQILKDVEQKFSGCFLTFYNIGSQGIAELSGLGLAEAEDANTREFSEPVYWKASETKKQDFVDTMKALGANIQIGGRFIHVSGSCSKGIALEWLMTQYRKEYQKELKEGNIQLQAIGAGDGKNDIAMLEAADIAVIIRSPVHPPPVVTNAEKYITHAEGPEGWTEGIQYSLEKLGVSLVS